MQDEPRETEAALTAALTGLVEGEHPSPELRDRIATATPPRRVTPRLLSAAVAAAVLVVALLAVVLTAGSDDDTDIATAPVPTSEDEPDVLGERVVREPSTATVPSGTTDAGADQDADEDADDGQLPPPGPTVVPAPSPTETKTAAPAPKPTPTTAAPACRNSTDPACGEFRWDPAPRNQPATLTVTAPDRAIVVDEQVELALDMSDPDGRVTLACYSVSLDRPGLSTGSCAAENHDCPERYGPWSPPAGQPSSAGTTTVVEFHEPGTYTVTVDVAPADGCDNVDPYRSGARTSITVEVQAAA